MIVRSPLLVALLVVCIIVISPVMAQDNPYKHSSDITDKDIAVNVESGIAKVSDSSNITFSGAEYTHTLGRVSIRMKPLMNDIDKGAFSKSNVRISGGKNQVKYSVYKDLIKEEITLNKPEPVRYSYDLWLSDWVTKQINLSYLHNAHGKNRTEIDSHVLGNEIINYAKDSTIDIQPDRWGNLVVYVNNKEVVIMPKPFAIDATGKRFELDYNLDKKNKIITITGNLTGAQYPLVIDPTERVTNGGFETGDFSGWTVGSTCSYCWTAGVYSWYGYPMAYLAACNENCRVSISQPIDLTNVDSIDAELSSDPWSEEPAENGFRVFVDNDQLLNVNYIVDDELFTIDTSSYTGSHIMSIRCYAGWTGADGIVYKVSAMADENPPVASFTGTPTSGTSPLTVAFTDTSTNSPTSWAWSFSDGQTSTVQNPSQTYTAAGTYTVSLTATNAGGSNTTVKAGYINVTGGLGPVADFTGDPLLGTSPLQVQFTDNSTGNPDSWNWSFGDGEYSTVQNPSHEYVVGQTYSVSLTAANGSLNNTKTMPDYISVTCPSYVTCDVTLVNPPYINFGIDNVTFPNDSGVWQQANCYDNALIRWARAGDSSSFYATLSPWMWKRNPCCPNPGYSYAVDTPANKPIYIAAVENPDADVVFHHHAVDAELLTAENARNSTWESWNFFNYHELNITRGWNQQIPNGTSSFWTEVGIEWINELPGEGQYRGDTQITFYIAPNSSVYLYPRDHYTESYTSQAELTVLKTQTVPDEINNEIITMKSDRLFTINNWEFDPKKNELVVYAHDIKHENVINNHEGRFIGNYSVRIVHDAEFEKIREDVEQQLVDLRQNPEYQISWISMVTDTNGDVPKKTAELWVDKSTPENKKLDNTVIHGWTIHVYPISR